MVEEATYRCEIPESCVLNLNGKPCSLYVLAAIATMLESKGEVLIRRCSVSTPGLAAFEFGKDFKAFLDSKVD